MPFDGRAQAYCDINKPDARALALDPIIDELANPERWCKGFSAREIFLPHEGRVVVAHCVTGALCSLPFMLRADHFDIAMAVLLSVREFSAAGNYVSIASWNDDPITTHADVMRVLRRARARLAAGERYAPVDDVRSLGAVV